MNLSQKIIETAIFLLAIPFFRITFKFMFEKGEYFFKKKNPTRMSFFYNYKKIVTFIINYIVPVMILIVIVSIWVK